MDMTAGTASSYGRVIEIITFLAAHPTESFTLTELARHLQLTNGSAHRVLSALTEARFLSRHPKHKTYSLGIAMVGIGQAALERHRGLDVARREMARLSDELNVFAMINTIVDDELLMLARSGISQNFANVMQAGERRPFTPPSSLVKIAWSDEPVVEAYFAKASFMQEAVVARMRASLEVIRERGYSMAAVGDGMSLFSRETVARVGRSGRNLSQQRLEEVLEQLTPDEAQLLDLDTASKVGVGYFSAPVFGPDGSVTFELMLSGLPPRMSREVIEGYARRLRASAAAITSETYGRMPF